MTYKEPTKKEIDFLRESNYIEQEYSVEAFDDSVKAWQYAVKNTNNIDINYILTIHYLLMSRLNKKIAGKFRNCNVFIGGIKKEFLSTHKIEYDIENWINDTQITSSTLKKDKAIRRIIAMEDHVKFENIHPFTDGNGRVGRILYNIELLQLNLPIHIIREGVEQYDYYKWFK